MREVCSRLHNLQLTLFLSHVDLGKYWLKFQECCLLHNSTSKRHYTKENVTDKYQSPFLNKGCTLLLLVVLTHMCVVLVVSYCSSVLELFVWRLGGMKLHLALKRRRLISRPATGLSLSLFFVLGLLYKNVPGEDSKLENRGLFSTEVISMYINLSPVLE